MSEDTKEKIFEWLKKSSSNNKKFNAKQIHGKTRIASLPTIHKWIQVLVAEKRIKEEDYGNIRLVWFE